MQRLLLDKLTRWKDSPERKPLLLQGVRQCGKTYLLKEFGKTRYQDAAYFNFEKTGALGERFAVDFDVSRIISELGVMRKKKIEPSKTLVIFDEIQFCPQALTSLKYFSEDMPEINVACAGSFLGLALAKPTSFPVGKVDFLTLYPMNFFEFLLASGEELLCLELNRLSPGDAVSSLYTKKLENYLREYLITGGMPEVVSIWQSTRDIAAVEEVQEKIISGYQHDFAKHAPAVDFPKVSRLWHCIPEQLAKENRKFIYSQVKRGLRAKDLEGPLEWLISAGLAYKVEKISKPLIPLSAYADHGYFKLYLSDVGLLRKIAQLPAEAILEKNSAYREFKGAMSENYALCEFISTQGNTPYYWKSENTAEVDFVAQFGMDIVPIEVKSERNTRSKSLAVYREKFNPRVSITTSMENVSGVSVINVPLYLLWRLRDYAACTYHSK